MSETPAEQAMELIRRLEETGALGTGGRLPALLRYLVQEELAGRGDRLKAYSIATEILGRGRDFDPAQDSIVRVEIGRLRKALDLFFATQGRDEPIKIEIPRGASRPKISLREPLREEAPPRRWRLYALAAALALLAAVGLALALRPAPRAYAQTTPKLILLPVRTEGADPELRALALGLRAQLAEELSLQKWLTVLLLDAIEGDGPKLFAAAPVLIRDSEGYAVSAQLTSEPDHVLRWSARYRDARLSAPLAELAAGLAGELARDLGYPLGPIGQAVGAKSRATDAQVEDRFLCMMNAYRYWNDGEPKQAADARACLTRLTAQAADFAEGRAALALLALEQGGEAARAEAAALLRGAPEDDRLSIKARMTLAACSGEREAVKGFAHALAAAAPNDPESLAEAAAAAGLAALDWPFALETESRALKLARRPKSFASHASAAKATLEGDFAAALRAISRAPQNGDALGQAMLYLIARRADAPARAQGAEAALAKAGVEGVGISKLIGRACWRQEVREAFARLAEGK